MDRRVQRRQNLNLSRRTPLPASQEWVRASNLGVDLDERVLFLYLPSLSIRVTFVALWNGENDSVQKYATGLIRRSGRALGTARS